MIITNYHWIKPLGQCFLSRLDQIPKQLGSWVGALVTAVPFLYVACKLAHTMGGSSLAGGARTSSLEAFTVQPGDRRAGAGFLRRWVLE